jgi:uncharacterized protein (TIGR02217 family)
MTITVTVDAVQLPETVQRGLQVVLDDPVDILTSWSGVEQRNRKNTQRPRTFQCGYAIKQQADLQAVYDLWMTNGMLIGFLFKDHLDHSLVNQRIDLTSGSVNRANGTNDTFLLFKTYTTASRSYRRRITRPVAGSVFVTVDGAAETHFTLNPLGTIVFAGGHIPGNGKQVVVTAAEYVIPVRYATKLNVRVDTAGKISIQPFSLMELFETPQIAS